jgi:hypothetical protein
MGRFIALMTLFLVIVAAGFLQIDNTDGASQKPVESSAGHVVSSKKLVLEILETDSGVGGTYQFVFLRVFSDRTVQLHPKRSQDIKKTRVSQGEISQAQLDTILALAAREDVKKLPSTFRSTYTPIDFNWTLDMKIPRGTEVQQIRLVNFYPEMAKQNNKPYPEALVKLVCSVLALRHSLNAETPYPLEECRDTVSNH